VGLQPAWARVRSTRSLRAARSRSDASLLRFSARGLPPYCESLQDPLGTRQPQGCRPGPIIHHFAGPVCAYPPAPSTHDAGEQPQHAPDLPPGWTLAARPRRFAISARKRFAFLAWSVILGLLVVRAPSQACPPAPLPVRRGNDPWNPCPASLQLSREGATPLRT